MIMVDDEPWMSDCIVAYLCLVIFVNDLAKDIFYFPKGLIFFFSFSFSLFFLKIFQDIVQMVDNEPWMSDTII